MFDVFLFITLSSMDNLKKYFNVRRRKKLFILIVINVVTW